MTRRGRAAGADLLETLAVGSVLAVVAMFLAQGGATRPATTGGALVAAGQLAGLVVTDLLLLQLLLAARVPWVDRIYGLDRALRAHRLLGRVTVPGVLVHVGLILTGDAALDGRSPGLGWLGEGGHMLHAVPHMVSAAGATAILIAVALSSVRAARRRLGYERWHLVHLSAYVAVALAVPHELVTGSDFSDHRAAYWYWVGLYAVVVASVLWWRLLVPLGRSLWHRLEVEQLVAEGPGVWSVWIRGRRLDRLGARSGQFFHWRFAAPGLLLAAHPWSLSSRPEPTRMRITVREYGEHSRRIGALTPGTRVFVEGPYGAFTADRRVRTRVALIGAGIGITPLRALAEDLCRDLDRTPGGRLHAADDITLLYRCPTSAEAALGAELAVLGRERGLDLCLLPGPSAPGRAFPSDVAGGHSDGWVLQQLVPDVAERDVYVCGPPAWMELVRAALSEAKVSRGQVHDERFAW